MLHWLSYATGSVCCVCVSDVCTGYSMGGISGYWKTNGSYTAVMNDCSYTVCNARGRIGLAN